MFRHELLALLVILLASSGRCSGQDSPDAPNPPQQTVMVVSPEAILKSGSDVVGKSKLGDILIGREVNGDWLWIPDAKGWIQQKNFVPVEKAVEHFSKAIEKSPTSQAYFQRATVRVALGEFSDAVGDLTRAVQLDPKNLAALNERGTTYRRLGKRKEAKADFDAVIAGGAKHPAVFTNRALVLIDIATPESVEAALVDLRVALELDSRFAPAWEASAEIREKAGLFDKALEYYRVAIEIDPNFALAWNNRAWVLATAPDAKFRNGQLAVESATKACELTGYEKSDMLDTLAAALAETGQFEQAVARSKQAIEKASEPQKETLRARQKLYEAGKPFRQAAQ
jgi:tetratricopeptide (TPR) repeat protein